MQTESSSNAELRSRQTRRHRRAMSLVEVSVAVALSAILLGVVVSFAVGLQQWDVRFREHSLHGAQLDRLAETIRADIRQATDVSLAAKETLVVTARGGDQTRYELRPEGCQRFVERKDNGSAPSDLFSIGPAVSWHVEGGATGRRRAIIVWLEPPSEDEAKAESARLLTYAALGADFPAAPKDEVPAEPNPGE